VTSIASSWKKPGAGDRRRRSAHLRGARLGQGAGKMDKLGASSRANRGGESGLETGENECSQGVFVNGFALPRRLSSKPLVPWITSRRRSSAAVPAPLARWVFSVSRGSPDVLDARFRYAESLRQVVALLAYPLQRAALAPAELFGATAGFSRHRVSLKQENESSRQSSAGGERPAHGRRAARGERAAEATARGARASRRVPPRCALLYPGARPLLRARCIIDKGSRQGIPVGQGGHRDIGVVGAGDAVSPLLAE